MPGMKMMTMIGLCALGLSATLTACDDDEVDYVNEEAIERDVEEAGRDLRQGAREVGQEMEQGAEHLEHEVEQGADAVEREVHEEAHEEMVD